MKRTIAILIGVLPKPRIQKRAALEKKIGDVHVICWDRGRNEMVYEPISGVDYCEIAVNTNDAEPIKRLRQYAEFSHKAMKILVSLAPDIIHVQGLDMLKIATDYKKRSNTKVKIIYEVADIHEYIADEQKTLFRKLLKKMLIKTDCFLSKYVDLLILTSERFYDIYFCKFYNMERILVFPNVPESNALSKYIKKETVSPYVIGFVGFIRYKKEIHNLITAAEKANVRLLFAGKETEGTEIYERCRHLDFVEWIGPFDFNARAAELYGECNAIYCVYDASQKNVREALPNKLYEAVITELPIIVAKGTYLADIVENWGVGISVDHNSVDELVSTICKLKDDIQFNEEISKNCREHFKDTLIDYYNSKMDSILRGWFEQ